MSTKLHISGGSRLCGTLAIESSKNALLPIIASTILVNGVTTLKNVPRISDIDNLLKILVRMNVKPLWNKGDLVIDTRDIEYCEVNKETASKIRGSIFVLGAILGRFKYAQVPYPGGCAIGSRPIDLHLKAFRDMGITIKEHNEVIECNYKYSKDTEIYLDFPSVGASENIILASVLGNRTTKIINAACEPEVADLCDFLNSCGAKICGGGTSYITIHGVKELSSCEYTAIPDRINTGSYLIATAVCGGDVTLTNTIPTHNANLISKLLSAGCQIKTTPTTINITVDKRLKAFGGVHTAPYPGFPTDIQSQLSTLACLCRGVTTIQENLFENRFKYIDGLRELGAHACISNKSLTLQGIKNFQSKNKQPINLYASDLRGGVALVIAGLAFDGKTIINNAEYIYRGHGDIVKDLISLGANIYSE